MAFKRLRGTHDIFGKDAVLFRKVESTARETFCRFGFEELRTPILEEKELFTRALGSETDVVQKEMYEFEDRSKTRVTLRPEGTAGIVRAYLENNFDKTQGLCKFYSIGPMFRSERPQAGRLRQFHQIGVEELGTDSPYADAEVLHALTTFLDAMGAGGYHVKLNNLGTIEERVGFKKVLQEYFDPKKDKLCEDCKNRLSKNVFRLLDCKNPSCRVIVEKSPLITGYLSGASKEHFDKVRQALETCGISHKLDPYMVRGLDYYTKTVFEISHPKLGAQDALAAGGRYDHLIETFGGDPAGAVGFAIGVERLLMCLVSEEVKDAYSADSYFIATLGEASFKEGFKIVSQLRKNGISAEMDLTSKSLKSQMRYADKLKYQYVIVLGDNELQSGNCQLKDMKTGLEQPRRLDGIIAQALATKFK